MLETKDIEAIVKQIVSNMDLSSLNTPVQSVASTCNASGSDWGVYDRVEDAIEAAYKAQKIWVDKYKIEDRDRVIDAIRQTGRDHAKELAEMIVEETKMGRVDDKIEKHLVVCDKTPGTECLTTNAMTSDNGLMLEEFAPFGVIGSITPSTNPTETIINNTISMIAGGNSVVFNVHPGAKNVCAYCLKLLNKAIVEAGGPRDLITMAKEPTMENVTRMTENPKIRLMAGTGGMGMVNALLRSGKKTIGAGAGNPPVVIDETADISLAAREVFQGASFDNNLLCFDEKEVFIVNTVADEFIRKMQSEGAYLLNRTELDKILNLVFIHDEKGYRVNKEWVGKDASLMLETIGIRNQNTRLLICDVPADHPFVLVEQLMPVLPIVRCRNFDEAIEGALVAEHGNRHTASMFSKNVDNLTRFAKLIETTIFVKNGANLRGVGIGGNGHTTMTIAGPTGEGLTCARSFTRQRRCMLADGGFRIV